MRKILVMLWFGFTVSTLQGEETNQVEELKREWIVFTDARRSIGTCAVRVTWCISLGLRLRSI